MKIIDILNKMTNGTLEDGFKFCYRDTIFTYDKGLGRIYRGNNALNSQIGEIYALERILKEEVLLFQEEAKEKEKREESKKIEELNLENEKLEKLADFIIAVENRAKINELVRAVNKLIKESEVK